MTLAIIALGSNINPIDNIQQASEHLFRLPESRVVGVSSLYRTKPVGYLDQPDFINGVIAIETNLDKYDLLSQLQNIENNCGRVRPFANAPRTLDLDLIDYGGEQNSDPKLILPHPRAIERAFVMVPLAEIFPDFILDNQKVTDILHNLDLTGIKKFQAA